MRNSFLKSLMSLAQTNGDVVLLTADLGYGVFEEFERLYPNQFFNVGVAEQNMTGIATGLALEGKIVFTYSIGNFPTLRCLEQIRNDACYHNVNVNVVCTGGGFSYGALGMSHHATEDLSILRALPGITIVAPCNDFEAEYATLQLANTPGVGYLRLDKTSVTLDATDIKYELGKANMLRDGSDISFIVIGGIMQEVFEAAELLERQGISSKILSMHTLKPLDISAISECIDRTRMIVTVEENNIIGGLGGAVAEFCLESGKYPEFFARIGMTDQYSSIVGDQQYLRQRYNMDAKSIANIVGKKLLTTRNIIGRNQI